MTKELKHTIHSPADCLSEKMLFDYIDNKLSNKERHIVEKHLLDCELCSDALEGLELVKDRNRIAIIKETINKKILESTEKEAVVVSFNYKLVFSIAAAIALLCVGLFYVNTIGLKESAQADMAELKPVESPNTTAPPPPPAPMDEKETSVSQIVSGAGNATVAAESEEAFKLAPQKAADQQNALAEGKKLEPGFYKGNDGDLSDYAKQSPDAGAANGAVFATDEITSMDSRNDNNLETIVTDREKDAKLTNEKKSAEIAASGAIGGTYSWSTIANPEQNKNQQTSTQTTTDKSGEQTELAKKSDKFERYRKESSEKGKEKLADSKKENRANDEDVTITGNVAYEPPVVTENNDAPKSETKNTAESNTRVTTTTTTNSTPVFESEIKADSVEPVYTIVEEMPEYPGGTPALIKSAGKELSYPAKDDTSNSYGTILIEFTVDSSGKAVHPKLIKPKSAALEKQVVEFVNKMPKWKAGRQNNKNVSVKLILPIKIEVK